MASWQPTVRGTRAVCKILAAIVSADGDVLPKGSWDAAVQRVRWAVSALCATLHAAFCLVELYPMSCTSCQTTELCTCHIYPSTSCRCRDLQPPPALASAWPEQRESLLQEVAAALGSSPGGVAASGRSSTSAADDPTAEPVRIPQATEGTKTGSSDEGAKTLQQPAAAADHPAAEPDWSRCPLSGKVMQDPVLYGSEGHSFERSALEQWLAANPGVHPISRQPLLPGEGRDVLPNDALRTMIQQMHAAT